MKRIKAIVVVEFAFILIASFTLGARAQNENGMETFIDSNFAGINIKVNATKEAMPGGDITVILKLSKLPEVKEVDMEHFNLSIFGFLYGKEKKLIANITGNALKEYNITRNLPENIWENMYGEITLTYHVTYEGPFGSLRIDYPNVTAGFAMTYVENIYLEQLKQIFRDNLDKDLTPENLNETLLEYKQLKESQNELSNTRVLIGILVVTTVFFAATTLYLFIRKPKEYW